VIGQFLTLAASSTTTTAHCRPRITFLCSKRIGQSQSRIVLRFLLWLINSLIAYILLSYVFVCAMGLSELVNHSRERNAILDCDWSICLLLKFFFSSVLWL